MHCAVGIVDTALLSLPETTAEKGPGKGARASDGVEDLSEVEGDRGGSEEENRAKWKCNIGDNVSVLCCVEDSEGCGIQEWFEIVVVDFKR